MSSFVDRCLPRRSRAEEGRKILFPVSASFLSMKLTGKHLYCPENVPPASPPKKPPNISAFNRLPSVSSAYSPAQS